MGLADFVAVNPPGLEVTVYEVIVLPPLEAGGVNTTLACPTPGVALFITGAPGNAAGLTARERAEAGPVPTAFVALTVKVYDVPFVRPVTTIGLVRPVAILDPGLDVTVYEVIGAPPLFAGGVKLTEACAFPATAVTVLGAEGTWARGETLAADEAGPVPKALVAVTVKV